MPDWCANTLVVSGKPEDVGRFRSESDPISAGRFVPMPHDLRGIIPGVGKIDGKKCYQWREVDGVKVPLSVEEIHRLTDTYGAANWYDWSILHWGTKWEFDEVKVGEAMDRKVVYTFLTAWSPPMPVVEAMSKKYLSLSFRLRYAAPDCDFKGSFWCKSGKITRDKRVPYYSKPRKVKEFDFDKLVKQLIRQEKREKMRKGLEE